MHRLYENDDLAVFWDSDKCFHAKRCVHSSPETFDIKRRPWIDLSRCPNPEIWNAVSQCPSGALTIAYRHEVDVIMDMKGHRSVALYKGEEIGECEYHESETGWTIFHTGVREEFEGKGIARRLVFKVLEAAEKNCDQVTATCSYALRVMGAQSVN